MLSDRLGLDFEQIEYQQGDTDTGMAGTGTFGSRASGVGGASLMMAADKVIEKSRKMAAHHLETSEGDIEFADGVDKSLERIVRSV